METRSHVMDGSQMRKAMPKAHGAGPGITIDSAEKPVKLICHRR